MRLKISQIAKKLNKSTMTIWNYMSSGKLRFHQDIRRGNRYMYWNEVLEDLGITPKKANKMSIAYCRVSTKDQINDLEYQKKLLEQYCSSKGYNFKIISDIGSGINYNKKGLKELIKLIIEDKIDNLIVTYKDRLLRFGNEIIFEICNLKNVNIEIVNQTDDVSKEQELVQDVLQIITVFSSKLYGSRSHKNKNIVNKNKELWIQKNK